MHTRKFVGIVPSEWIDKKKFKRIFAEQNVLALFSLLFGVFSL